MRETRFIYLVFKGISKGNGEGGGAIEEEEEGKMEREDRKREGGGGGGDRPLESQPLSLGARSNQPL